MLGNNLGTKTLRRDLGANRRLLLPWITSRLPVIREQSQESSLIECEETVNSTRSCLCVHFQRKVKVFRQRGLIDNRLVLELEA